MRGVEVKHVRRKDVDLERMWDIESATDKGVLYVGHSKTVMRRKAKLPTSTIRVMPTTTHLVVLGVLNVAVIALALYSASAQTATGIIQTLVLGDTLWILWLYTRATFTLAKTAEDQMTFLKAQFVDEKVGELIKSKPIVFTDRGTDGETRISNLGDASATNVWYLADNGGEPIPLGSLRKGESRVVSMKLADRHVLIAEQRQMPQGVARKFTPTLKAWTGHAFVHVSSEDVRNAEQRAAHRGVEPYRISTIMADV